ncbi:MAG: nucleotidyl transferase AbiEii/AbiGii toxin family protein [Bacteroidales bacterium]
MSTSDQTYKKLAIPHFKEVFDIIDKVMHQHHIPYYLIGASAIALELLKNNIKPGRGTRDIDFAIMTASHDAYQKVCKALREQGFQERDFPYRFYAAMFNVVIDILPFGDIEQNHTINFSDRKIEMHVLGMREVLSEAIAVPIEDKELHIPSLPGMVILKLVAWSDQPENRENDLADILKIIQHYFHLAFDEIVEHHNDIFPENDEIDHMLVAARVLGRKVSSILRKSAPLMAYVIQTLEANLGEVQKSTIAKRWAREKDWTVEYAHEVIRNFYSGIQDN